jgi:hypothetical protein
VKKYHNVDIFISVQSLFQVIIQAIPSAMKCEMTLTFYPNVIEIHAVFMPLRADQKNGHLCYFDFHDQIQTFRGLLSVIAAAIPNSTILADRVLIPKENAFQLAGILQTYWEMLLSYTKLEEHYVSISEQSKSSPETFRLASKVGDKKFQFTGYLEKGWDIKYSIGTRNH